MADNRTYANRGMEFEGYIKFANERYKLQKLACIEKQATEWKPLRNGQGKIVSAKVEEKASVDFLGRYKTIPIAIEAKSTFQDNIRFDEVQPHQADYMDEFTIPGTIGLVVVCFNLKHYFVIPWAFWQAAYNARVRPGATRTGPCVVEAFGQTWEVPRKFSVRMEELNPAWKMSEEDVLYGFNYLKDIERYIIPPTTGTTPKNSYWYTTPSN